MRNALVLVAVAAVALAAAWDALREQPATLAELGVSGRLVYSDARCRRRLVELPSGRVDTSPRTIGCGVFNQRGNLGIERGEVAWFAFAEGGVQTVLDRGELRRRHGPGARALRAAWLGGTRYAALVWTRRGSLLVLREGGRVLAELPAPGAAELRSSPLGGFVAVSGGGGLAVYDRDGRPVQVPRDGTAIAWSPDERFAAVTLPGEIAILPVGGGRETRLKLAARDIDWRA